MKPRSDFDSPTDRYFFLGLRIEAASSKVADESEERRKDALEAGLPASGEAVITDSRQKEPLDLSWLLLSLDRKFSRRACRSCRRTAEAGGGPGAATPSRSISEQ